MTTLHIVPQTHWDREWYLPFQSFRIKLVHLIDMLLDILDRDPTFTHFTLDGQTIILEDYLEIRPEREADLIHHIRSGRLLIGPWYVLPDEFLVSPEAIVRNLLRGGSMCDRFGARMDIGYLPDPFGHIGQMPQILHGFGIELAAFRRGLADEPCELWWQAPDGSRVLTAYLRDGYDNAARLPTVPSAFIDFIRERRDSLATHSAVTHLLLLNGTDHHEPQPEVPALVESMTLDDDKLLISTLSGYMTAVLKEIQAGDLSLPVVYGELRDPKRHHLLAGVLSSRTWIKQRNHTCETLLERWAEPFAAWAEIVLDDAPDHTVWTGHLATPRVRRSSAFISQAWRLLLQCHPHDSICGCSVDQVHKEMQARFDQVEQIGEEITRQNLVALTDVVDTTPLAKVNARSALVVFNPDLQSRTDLTKAHIEVPAGLEPFEIVDHRGQILPYRLLDRRARSLADMELDPDGLRTMLAMVQDGWVMGLSVQAVAIVQHKDHAMVDVVLAEGAEPNAEAIRRGNVEIERLLAEEQVSKVRLLARFATEVTLAFVAPEVPAHGYRTFSLRPTAQGPQPTQESKQWNIENDLLRVEVGSDGCLTLIDRRSGAIFPGLLRFSDQADRGDSYTFCPLEADQPIEITGAPPQVRRLIDDYEQMLELDMHFRLPAGLTEDRTARSDRLVDMPLHVRVRLMTGIPRVDMEITLDNLAEDHRLQVLFPLPFEVTEADYDGHYEIVRRATAIPSGEPDWAEQPAMEVPMRNFAAASGDIGGLMIASHGLREARVSPEGVIAVTLLRCFGWLSRDDLATRKGGAGPQITTPGGQVPGKHTFHISMIPFDGDPLSARAQAVAFQTTLRAVGTTIHPGKLPSSASLLSIDHPAFALSTVKIAEDGQGLVMRGVNLSHQPLNVGMRCLLPIRSASKARIDETPLEVLPVEKGSQLKMEVGPQEIITLRLDLDPPRSQG